MCRCSWCQATPVYRAYHDAEWGFPVSDDRRLFEKICLEGFQSGLSWLTILNKREAFRKGFANFEVEKLARFKDRDVERLLGDAGIVRHRGKIVSAINNAGRALELKKEFGSLAAYFWRVEPPAMSAVHDDRAAWPKVAPTTSRMSFCMACWVRVVVRPAAVATTSLLTRVGRTMGRTSNSLGCAELETA